MHGLNFKYKIEWQLPLIFTVIMFEHRTKPLLSSSAFKIRVFKFIMAAFLLILFSLLTGIFGYHFIAGFSWIDSILNASMILAGMGEIDPLPDNASKLFASAYALFSGITFLSCTGILLAPIVHRFFHKFHL